MISPNNTREITPELIIEVVSDHFNVPAAELKGKTKRRDRSASSDRYVSLPKND